MGVKYIFIEQLLIKILSFMLTENHWYSKLIYVFFKILKISSVFIIQTIWSSLPTLLIKRLLDQLPINFI